MPGIRRITMFKIGEAKDQQKLLGMYKDMQGKATKVRLAMSTYFSSTIFGQGLIDSTALQNGQPYILAVEAGTTQGDERSQGYTIVATSVFKDREDFDFYDKECEAHAELRTFARSVSNGFCMVFFEMP